jgi:hypothetical protein
VSFLPWSFEETKVVDSPGLVKAPARRRSHHSESVIEVPPPLRSTSVNAALPVSTILALLSFGITDD